METTLHNINSLIINKYLETDASLRSKSSYPYLVSYNRSIQKNCGGVNIPIYFKQPQHWLSSCYDKDLSKEEMEKYLIAEYEDSLFINPNRSYSPIRFFLKLKEILSILRPGINLIYNNLVKCSRRDKPDWYDPTLNDLFNQIMIDEFKLLNAPKSIFCVGPDGDYTGRMSYMFLNDVDIEKLTVERPFNVYKDFLGHELLHTYHPSYWNLINIDMEQVILDFILR